MTQAYWAEGIAGTAVFEKVFREVFGTVEAPATRYPSAGRRGHEIRKGCDVFPGGSGRP